MKSKHLSTLVIVLLITMVCTAAGQRNNDHRHDTYMFSEKFEADLDGIDMVKITTLNGSMKIETWDENRIAIDVTEKIRAHDRADAQRLADEIGLAADVGGSVLRIDVDYGRFENGGRDGRDWNYAANLKIRLPARLLLDLNSVNGSVMVRGLQGDLDVVTVNGSIISEACTGYADLHSTNGRIEVDEPGGHVEARTTNGSINADLSEKLVADVDLHTTNGSVTLRLARDKDLQLIAETAHPGRLSLDFPVTLEPGVYRSGYIKTTFGEGKHRVTAKTTNGSIRIRD